MFVPTEDTTYEPYIPHIEVTPEPVVEGKNVSLQCFAYYEIGFNLFPNWSLPEPALLKVM